MPKTTFSDFSKAIFPTQLWETDRFTAVREFWEIFRSILSKHVAPLEYLSIDKTLYPMRQQIGFRQYNSNKPHRLLLKSLNDTRFLYKYKSVPYAAKPKAWDGPYYVKSTIDCIKDSVAKMEADQPITGRTIPTDRLYASIESINLLLDHAIATVGELNTSSTIPSELFDTHNREIFFSFFKRRRRTFAWHLTPSKKSQKERKILLYYRPPDHFMTKQLMMVKKIPK